MIRMHCNREVIRLPDDGTQIVAYCEECDNTFKQRKRGPDRVNRTLAPKLAAMRSQYANLVLIDSTTGKQVQV